MTEPPLVTVVVPAYEEESNIEACIASISAQDYPMHRLEIVVVDGGSSDGTVAAATRAFAGHRQVHGSVVTSSRGGISGNLNTALAAARGEVVCRVDAKCRIPPHYVRRCVELLADQDVSVVGGRPVMVAEPEGTLGRAIARAHNNRWTTGLSRYMRARTSGPCETVYLGAFRRSDLELAGGWDERLRTQEDFDLNRRLASRGAVWFDTTLDVARVPSTATLTEVFGRQRRLGRGRAAYWRHTGEWPRARHWALLMSPPLMVVATVGWVLAGPRRSERAVLASLTAVAACLALEVGGAREPRARGCADHFVGAGAVLSAAAGWLSGVAEELVAGRRQ
jgi:glycosyltransferase involved in cell wall biosynthesis